MEQINFSTQVPVRYKVDIFIAGGGPAGVAAGVAAARKGASVFIAEEQCCFGGLGTSGMVPAFMQFSDGINFNAGGIGKEIFERLKEMGGTGPDHQFSIRLETFKRLYDEMVTASGAEFSFHTKLIGAQMDGDTVTSVVMAAKSGFFAVKAKVYIDCTGDGDLSVMAGAPYEKGDEKGACMPSTLCSLWAGIDWDRVRKSPYKDDSRVEEAYNNGVFDVFDLHLPGMWRVGYQVGGGNIGHAFGADGTDERSLTKSLIEQRKRLLRYETYYKTYLQGFENMELVATASILGVRETRRIMGDYVLCKQDFIDRAVFSDEIGRYSYPVDIHPSGDKASYEQFLKEYKKDLRYNPGETYGIPYRTLTPKGVKNLLVAGRCISTDRYLQASVRVMPGCYITGQAAGMAACMALDTGSDVRKVDVLKLRENLRKIGGYLPDTNL